LLPAYLTEKAKNMATKEDISGITKQIKEVESKISIKTTGEIDYNSLKRKIILDFFGAYSHFETLLFRDSLEYDTEQKNLNMIDKINNAQFNYNLKQSELSLFLNSLEFNTLFHELEVLLLTFQHELIIHKNDLNHFIRSYDDLDVRYAHISESKSVYHKLKMEHISTTDSLHKRLISNLQSELKSSFN
jgi:hypothetical protein